MSACLLSAINVFQILEALPFAQNSNSRPNYTKLPYQVSSLNQVAEVTNDVLNAGTPRHVVSYDIGNDEETHPSSGAAKQQSMTNRTDRSSAKSRFLSDSIVTVSTKMVTGYLLSEFGKKASKLSTQLMLKFRDLLGF